jgi:hypothetical protein
MAHLTRHHRSFVVQDTFTGRLKYFGLPMHKQQQAPQIAHGMTEQALQIFQKAATTMPLVIYMMRLSLMYRMDTAIPRKRAAEHRSQKRRTTGKHRVLQISTG